VTTLLTGASGHVGQNLLRELLSRGETVRALVRGSSDLKTFEGLKLETAQGDLNDPASLRAAAKGCDRVYHCAARVQTVRGRERALYDTNVLGTRNLLRAARAEGVGRVVVTSSLGAVGHRSDRPSTEDDGFDPFAHHLPYEASKAWVEHECLQAAVEGQDVVIAISTAVLGPYDFGPSRMGRVIQDFCNRKLSAYIPGGFEFVNAADLARGHILAMEKGQRGQRYILSTGFFTVDALMALLEDLSGVPRPKLRLPPPMMTALAHVSHFVLNRVAPERPQRFTPDAVRLLTLGRRASTAKAQTELGYAPTTVEAAVREAYQWCVAQGLVPAPRKSAAQVLKESST
jgi:nucleoside-diphosphate-sugar epimerase